MDKTRLRHLRCTVALTDLTMIHTTVRCTTYLAGSDTTALRLEARIETTALRLEARIEFKPLVSDKVMKALTITRRNTKTSPTCPMTVLTDSRRAILEGGRAR